MFNVAILKHDESQIKVLEGLIYEWADHVHDVAVFGFMETNKFLESMCECRYNAVFIDVDLYDNSNNKSSGIEFARALRKRKFSDVIIFMADTADYAIEGYEVGAYRYFLAPLQAIDVHACMDYVYRRLLGKTFTCSYRGEIHKVVYSSILYFESQKHYIFVHTSTQTYAIKSSLNNTLKLTPNSFIRCHRSFIVNLDYIKSFGAKSILLTNGTNIPVATKFVQPIREAISSIM